ncbi:MAG: AraC family transcriptional regulator [Kofleriaceae bacterium]|nr:AraC family transcriptional regulator [Kofleriaceae bacterium]
MPRAAIRDLPFRHNLKPNLGLEIFRLTELFDRVRDDSLETPQRPDFHTVYIGLTGKGSLLVDFTAVPLGAGTLTIVARGRVQQFTRQKGLDAWLVLARPELLTRQHGVLDTTWERPSVALGAEDSRDLRALAEQIAAEQARPLDSVQPPLLAALFDAVLLRAERLARDARPAPPAELARFFTTLEADFMRTRSVAHYAKRSGLSARRLAELVVAHAGKSPKKVIDDRVVLEQKRLLAHTDVSVKELAARTGFDEPTNLVKFFRHHVGVTPLEFRKNLPSARRS